MIEDRKEVNQLKYLRKLGIIKSISPALSEGAACPNPQRFLPLQF